MYTSIRYVESRTKPGSGETVWTVDYPAQYEDEKDELNQGADSGELNFTEIKEGERLLAEDLRLKKKHWRSTYRTKTTSVSSNSDVPLNSSPLETSSAAVILQRPHCRCLNKKKVGTYCLAKMETAGPFASKHPNKQYWRCMKPKQEQVCVTLFVICIFFYSNTWLSI
jgi:hypothetical protein